MTSRQDVKNDRILRALLKLPDNKRCADCDTLGPQYVVTDFNVFVCTVCSGVHRQFNHRVKGVSMATFKPEEIEAIENGGNAVAMGTYLARWTPADLPRPGDRSPAKVRDWVETVFVRKQFYAEPEFGARRPSPPPPAAAHAATDTGVPGHLTAPSVSRAPSDAAGLILEWAGDGSPQSGAPAAAPPAPAAWAAFDNQTPPAMATASSGGGWATFDAPAGAASAPPAAPPPPPPSATGWASFDAPPAPASTESVGDGAPPATAGWASFDGGAAAPTPSSASAHMSAATPSPAPSRAELPPDLFMVTPAPQPPPLPPPAPPAAASPAVDDRASGGASSAPPDPFSTLAPGLGSALPSPGGSAPWSGAPSPGGVPAASAWGAADAGSAGPKPKTGNPFA